MNDKQFIQLKKRLDEFTLDVLRLTASLRDIYDLTMQMQSELQNKWRENEKQGEQK